MPQHSEHPQPLLRLIDDSLLEAEFLWGRLDSALDAHNETLQAVERWTERRLIGALDGVRIAGRSAIDPLLTSALRDRDPDIVSVAAYLLAVLSDPEAERVLEAGVQSASSHRIHAFARGLGRAADIPALH